MANDMELLQQLENTIGEKLEKRQLSRINDYMYTGYALDSEGRVTGLNLDGISLDAETFGGVSRFRNLEILHVYHTGLNSLSPLRGLTRLTQLYCSLNQVSDLAPLQSLTNLTELGISSNQVSDLSPLQGLTNLTQLFFHSNQVSDLTPLQSLTNLAILDARNNSISRLPEAFLQLDMKIDMDNDDWNPDVFTLYGNPLETPPPEIIRKGKTAIGNYFNSLQEDTSQPLNEVKVILVGDGGAGKTSLVNHIIHRKFDPRQDPTEGIDIKTWQPENTLHDEDIQVRVWDFGGQEILHATHQFFLSKRSLYILVLDGRKDEKTEYWLKQIQSFGHNSPVLVVLNKIDHNPRFDVNRSFLKHKYPNILQFYRVSCLDENGIPQFLEALVDNLDKVELLGSTWSVKWFRVKERLEALKEPYITYQRYREICEEEQISDEKTRATLVEFLNDLGVVLHFSDRDLAHTHVLDPEWVTNAVYKIINGKNTGARDGLLPMDRLDHILAECPENRYCYPKETHGFIVGLMEKFELCYRVDNDNILIPDLLEENEKTAALESRELLTFIFQYDFFPRSIMPRCIVRLHKDIKNTQRWRTGVVLENRAFPHTTALVKADEKDGKITVWVEGDRKRDYFQTIRKTLHDIHGTFDKLEVKELMPLPDRPDIMIEYEELVGHEVSGRSEIFVGKLRRGYDVAQLLNGVVSEDKRRENH